MFAPLAIGVLDAPRRFGFADFIFEIERPTMADWVISRVTDVGVVPVAWIDGHTEAKSWLVSGVEQLLAVREFDHWEDAWQCAVAMPLPRGSS